MMAIFNFFGSILGYLLWFLYNIFHNYGVAIIFFTIIIKAVLFPFSVKSQRSMASQTKLADKQKELQAKYGNNKQKYNEELMKLYEKEGVNPSSGCLTTLLPLPIMLGIYYSVIMPLSNTLHIASERIAEATDFINRIPGMVASATSGTWTRSSPLPRASTFWGWTCWPPPRAAVFWISSGSSRRCPLSAALGTRCICPITRRSTTGRHSLAA